LSFQASKTFHFFACLTKNSSDLSSAASSWLMRMGCIGGSVNAKALQSLPRSLDRSMGVHRILDD
jgi:hypothetical protein